MTEKKDTRVNDIIEAAINEFLEKGYDKTSMESIAARSNLSKGGLYHHFKSKVEILLAVNLKFLEPINEIFERTAAHSSPAEGLRLFVAEYLTYWNNHRREISLYFFTMNISFNDPAIMDYYKDFAQSIFGFFQDLFTRGQQMGLFQERDARTHAVAFISCMDGYLAYMMMDPALILEKSIAEIQDTFINDFLKKP